MYCRTENLPVWLLNCLIRNLYINYIHFTVLYFNICSFLTAIPQFLLYAARRYIRRITLGDHRETTIPLGNGLQNAIALDYDYNQNCIYWADITLDTIKRSFLNGSGR